MTGFSWNHGHKTIPGLRFYKYNDTLSAGVATTVLGSMITMAEMTNAQYGQLDDINITMTAYACGSDEGETLYTAWATINEHFGLKE